MVPWHTGNQKHFSDEISASGANLLTDPGTQLSQLCLEFCDVLLQFFDLFACGQVKVLGESCPLRGGECAKALGHLNQQSQKLQCLFTLKQLQHSWVCCESLRGLFEIIGETHDAPIIRYGLEVAISR